jgi:hypothetical protein
VTTAVDTDSTRGGHAGAPPVSPSVNTIEEPTLPLARLTRVDAAWTLLLAALSAAGAVTLVLTPSEVLRAHALAAFTLVLTFALGGVVADAMWNGRPWRWPAAVWASLLVMVFSTARYVEMLWIPDGAPELALAPRVLRVLMMVALFALTMRHRQDVDTPRPRPSPRPEA